LCFPYFDNKIYSFPFSVNGERDSSFRIALKDRGIGVESPKKQFSFIPSWTCVSKSQATG
jgi:hypothetical protein